MARTLPAVGVRLLTGPGWVDGVAGEAIKLSVPGTVRSTGC